MKGGKKIYNNPGASSTICSDSPRLVGKEALMQAPCYRWYGLIHFSRAIPTGRSPQQNSFGRYAGEKTYDLLPAGDTGVYWANGILLGSTLK